MKIFLFAALSVVIGIFCATTSYAAPPHVPLIHAAGLGHPVNHRPGRAKADVAGYRYPVQKNQVQNSGLQQEQKNKNNFANQQKNFDHLRNQHKHQDVAQQTDQTDVDGQCIMTYENWNNYVDWDLQQAKQNFKDMKKKAQNNLSNDEINQLKKLAERNRNALGQQQCVLTYNQLQIYERQAKARDQYDRVQGNQKSTKKDGNKYSNNNIQQQQTDAGNFDYQLGIMDRFCLVTYNAQWQNLDNELTADRKTTQKLLDYAKNKGQEYYNIKQPKPDGYENQQKNQKNQNDQYLNRACMVFDFQINLYTQWLANYGINLGKNI
ncbi:uncharacterized protein SPPG_03476 [Spizellomyces punctatus DAOM BR117]|uniref:Uncharacterized protein n=1 Tax=Spizellomyces punctatus (strain DAOM BR117) TaxID=645134 RepID=A0A0L0HJP2_SPIPD|nr:uncharacterized protein SPPG_03476 [Spizellomyces punctatus DAOM BR117]KND01681.1 hypothetical protein SPPG_03476 [Spizellomyces punctatus DAOM BR117]|eukprot:XP_016609720.1 hypothetical protein SPPG_03476 [Spizellomyces punctatus DAOM BR117]